MQLNEPANSNKQPIKAGVIGYPIAHSLSPVIHQYWLDRYDIIGSYETYEIKPDELEHCIKSLAENGFAGINVTLPHKEEAMRYVDQVGPVEQVIGAINTIWVDPETGTLDGNNTDYYGFYKNLEERAPDMSALAGGRAVVLGAGGAFRAIAAALVGLCNMPEIVVTNRTRETAEAKVAVLRETLKAVNPEVKLIVVDWEQRDKALSGTNLLVNTTSLGMEGKPKLEIDLTHLPKDALVTDIVYNPLETELLKQAKERGNPTVDGLGMLLHQAVLGFHKWFGVEPEVTEELRQRVLEEL